MEVGYFSCLLGVFGLVFPAVFWAELLYYPSCTGWRRGGRRQEGGCPQRRSGSSAGRSQSGGETASSPAWRGRGRLSFQRVQVRTEMTNSTIQSEHCRMITFSVSDLNPLFSDPDPTCQVILDPGQYSNLMTTYRFVKQNNYKIF